jgi:hypothetical protein
MKQLKACERGHQFKKSSSCPVCPICWSSYYNDKYRSDFPQKLGAPALRALLNADIKNLRQLTRWSEKQVLDLHGMGAKGVGELKSALRKKGLSFLKKK